MNNEMEVLIKKLRKELLVTRIFTGVLSLIMIAVLVGGFLLYKEVSGYLSEMQAEMNATMAEVEGYMEDILPVVDKFEQMDIEALNKTLDTMTGAMVGVDWKQVSEQLNGLDMEALNKVIDNLDTRELSVSLKNLNDVVEKLQNITDGMKSFFSKFTNR